MRVIREKKQLWKIVHQWKKSGEKIGFVPTMGYFHEGHLSLMRWCRHKAKHLVVSIFVNPLQFGPKEDYTRYPRDEKRDLDVAKKVGVDLVFLPEVKEVFPVGFATKVSVEGGLTSTLCAPCRPGHFDGVATIVLKLFQMVKPDVAVFGQKDFQQFRVIQRMVSDLDIPVSLVVRPIVRAEDGLALSSRNAYLKPSERAQAVCLYRSLLFARKLFLAGERRTFLLKRRVVSILQKFAKIEYTEFVDSLTLQPVKRVSSETLLAMAVRIGKVRLIDNGFLGGEDVEKNL